MVNLSEEEKFAEHDVGGAVDLLIISQTEEEAGDDCPKDLRTLQCRN
jgi:hypothetical protein